TGSVHRTCTYSLRCWGRAPCSLSGKLPAISTRRLYCSGTHTRPLCTPSGVTDAPLA
ncbi:hypothetical protein BD626DRAFT_532515, partial [Schizophyllum amplum]